MMTVKNPFSHAAKPDDSTPDRRTIALINEGRTDTERRELAHLFGRGRRARR